MSIDAVMVALATWFSRSEPQLGPMTIQGGRLPDTRVFIAGAVVAGLAAGVGGALWVRSRAAAASDEMRCRAVSSGAVMLAVTAGALGVAVVIVPLAWARALPLLAEAMSSRWLLPSASPA